MTPVSFHPPSPSLPLVNQIEDRDQIFISPNNMDSNSLSCPSFFDILDQQTRDIRELRHDQEDGELVLYGASSSHQVCNSSFISPQPAGTVGGHNLPFYKMGEAGSKSGYGSAKWMSSKMRLMLKTMTPSSPPFTDKVSFQNQEHENSQTSSSVFNNRNSTTRVCADCNTTSTPLWRSGPEGPKSLCNACGIRQRKARRAAAAANGEVTSMDTKTTRVHNKQKKLRTNHFVQFKNKWKGTSQAERKIPLKDFAWNSALHHQVFPRDEVAEAALLLMDLSCGFLHI